ncbi:hypothetical protein OROHE_011068 [Orobanche hederae]
MLEFEFELELKYRIELFSSRTRTARRKLESFTALLKTKQFTFPTNLRQPAVHQVKFGIRRKASFMPTRKESSSPLDIYNMLGSYSTKHQNVYNFAVRPKMAKVRGRTSGMLPGGRLSPLMPTHVKIVPGSGWTLDSNAHYLLVDPEGFNKEKLRVDVNFTANHLTVTGERQVNDREHVYIEEDFPIPANSDVDKISGKFDGEFLYVTVPKVVAIVQENKVPEIVEEMEPETVEARKGPEIVEPNRLLGNARIFFSKETIRKWEEDNGILRSAKEVLSKNKGMVITAVVAFSLGMVVSRKFEKRV